MGSSAIRVRRPWGACWMVAKGGEGFQPSSFLPYRGYPGFVSLQVPTSEAAVSADTHAFARLPPGGLRKIVICLKGPQAPSPKPPETWPTGPWGLDRHSHRFTSSCCIPCLRAATITQSADLGGALDGFRRRSFTVP